MNRAFFMDHEKYMRRTIELARKGIGSVSPNPRVGALIVSGGTVVSEGYHTAFGQPHAEIEAIRRLRDTDSPHALYVNLEPCSHHGKTPPCTEAIIQAGIDTVVYGMRDPNPKVSGKGLARLETAGIRVIGPVLETECLRLNQGFIKSMVRSVPWITLKIAQTADGRIALENGQSRWITSPESREKVHEYRSLHDAVLVGIDTVIQDNPRLTVRIPCGTTPRRIVLDSSLKIPADSHLIVENPENTIIVTSENTNPAAMAILRDKGVRILTAPVSDNRLQISRLWREFIDSGICSILVEGGSRIFTYFLKSNLADQILLFIAPKLFGQGVPSIQGLEMVSPDDAEIFSSHQWIRSGPDMLLEGNITCLRDLLKK